VRDTGNALYAAEGLRLQGEVALAAGDRQARRAEARRCFGAAVELARRQGAWALEQRAAASLAALPADAPGVLR
jgi:hypothetical protein